MKQRLLKAVSCIALMISVFFCTVFPVYADELDPNDYDPTYVVGSSVTKQVYVTNTYATRAIGQAYVSNYAIFTLPGGYVYSGQLSIYFDLHGTKQENVSAYVFNTVDHNVTCSSSDVGVAYRYVSGEDYHYRFYIDLTFNGLYAVEDLPITVGISMYAGMAADVSNVQSLSWALGKATLSGATDFVSRNWTASLPDDYNVGGVVQDSALQQMQQQQQIADQQAQQSSQQHDNLVNGYDNAANDNMLADKNSVLQGFEQQQDQAMSNGQQYVADFSANYDTARLQAMAPAFMMISTWFNDLWGGMGNFSTVLIVGLMLCVAGYILKLKH